MFRWIERILERRSAAASQRREAVESEAFEIAPYLNALSRRQIRAILGIVREEIRLAEERFGHTIGEKDAFSEKCFFLWAFQQMGGIMRLSTRISFEEAQQKFYEGIEIAFEEELERYFNEWNGEGSRVWYRCHLQSVANELLRAIWSDEITEM